ncbi:MAG: tetratricopeptide repeat protein, partial [Ignavibacteriaceae bacterium]
ESFGSSRSLTRLILYLNKFKTTQLVRNSIHWVSSLFSSEESGKAPGTLMSRMAKNQYILLNSDKFNAGIEQFRENLNSILRLIKDKGIPVVIGRLVSNLKDQKPFISVNTPDYETADQVYKKAEIELNENNFNKADSLFRLAKDLDALRFRAPEKMNSVINQLGIEYNAKIVKTDSIFDSNSPEGIVGDNLIVDHLHPNIRGNQLLGKAYYDVMEKSGFLPKYEKPNIPFAIQDSLTRADFMFTQLDSIIGNDIIKMLKSDWPFVKNGKQETMDFSDDKNFLDETASEFLKNKISWADAHLKVATEYLRKDDIKNYLKYMDVLIYQYPELKDLRTALKYFYQQRKIDPRDYTIKRLGIISLMNGNYNDAISNLTECYKSNPKDAMVLFNLAKAYSETKDFNKSINYIKECLKIKPDYPGANEFKMQISDSIKIKSRE